MSTEFKDITIFAKPDPQKVKEKGFIPPYLNPFDPNSRPIYRYIFPFPCSSHPPTEWIEMFKMVWQAKITEWVKKKNDSLAVPITVFDSPEYIQPSVNIQGSIIELECEIHELSHLSEYLTASIDATNQRYNETLEERDEKQRTIREAIDAIKLP